MILSGASFLAPSGITTREVHGRQAFSQQERTPFRIVSWGIEDLFDTYHDSLGNNREYPPDAIHHWNYSRYKKKLTDVTRVITVINEWNPPALVGLCEVENDTMFCDLTRRSPLKELSCRYVMTNSPDSKGIDVVLLYRWGLFKLSSSHSISISPFKQHRPTRDLLHVNGLLLAGDTLDIFVCHLPSRSGGARESEPYRLYVAHVLYMEVDSIMDIRPYPQVITTGDFNDYPTNQSALKMLKAKAPPVKTNDLASTADPANASVVIPSSLKLYHLLARKVESRNFSPYRFRGEWGLLGHLIVSGTLSNQSNHFLANEEKANVCPLPFLLKDGERYDDKGPFRTYRGMEY